MTVDDVLRRTGPRKLLALDGGGIRGLITIEVLARLESLLRSAKGPDLVLSDYFDYVAGTGTGAIIATCISLGMSIDAIRKFYLSGAAEMFDASGWLRRFTYKYEDEGLATKLREVFGADTTFGSDRLRTLLLIVLRNATTDSPWPLSNNPRAKYNDRARPTSNLYFPLWQLVRASTAPPTYFPPEVIKVDRYAYVFVDGGMTMYNNPAFQLFLMSTLEPYRLTWPTGADKMLLVSIGTGTSAAANANLAPQQMNLLYNASPIPSALMHAASVEQDLLCRAFGDCRHGDPIDREIGDLRNVSGPLAHKLFTYVRYNADLSSPGLAALGLPDINPDDVMKLDSVEHVSELRDVGGALARVAVRPEHFDGF